MSAQARVRVCREGLLLGPGKDGIDPPNPVVPLYAGAMHYWRHAPEEWGACLDAVRAMGLRLVDTYVPWGIHEVAREKFDFGEDKPWLDLVRFLEMAHERGLYVILRPGPHINAELTYFGLPERVVWTEPCQARSPKGNPVLLPMIPAAFPVPSYASDAFHEETARWFAAVGERVAHLRYPDGPIVLLQIDNEGALYFRDGAYDQDYHPDSVRLFRDFLREKYPSLEQFRASWNDDALHFATVEPPKSFDAKEANELARHMDWVEFQEELLARAMDRFARSLAEAGLSEIPTFHNMPLGEAATPLNAARMGRVLDLVALDYYHRATPDDHAMIAKRTSELVSRSEGTNQPAFGAEVGAGFPPFFAPMSEEDSLYTLLAALAYGLRGFNLYMAVDRDRWVGAPIDVHGTPTHFADRIRAIIRALEKVEFHTLRRRVEVRLVIPRAVRRLARAMHAFGPVTPAFFNIAGANFAQSCSEEDLGLGEIPPVEAEEYLQAFERALQSRGVPFAYAGGEGLTESLTAAKWIICSLAGGVKPAFVEQLRDIAARGVDVTVGPQVPLRDGSMRLLEEPLSTEGLSVEPLHDRAGIEKMVAHYIEKHELATYSVEPDSVQVTVHEDQNGTPRLVFVMNPTDAATVGKISLPGASRFVDVLSDNVRIARSHGSFHVELPPKTVRIFVIEA
ncbi:MAG: beta-galactosidase [Polyangiaceae bacterium]